MATEPRGCFGAIFGSFGSSDAPGASKTPKAATFPYLRANRFLSPAESSFLAALRIAVGDRYAIFAKVRLLDLLTVGPGDGRQAAFNRVQAKQIDFLLCELATSRPVLALELDDRSHQQSDRRARDAFVEEVLEVIGLPALRVPVSRSYDPAEIARLISTSLSGLPAPRT